MINQLAITTVVTFMCNVKYFFPSLITLDDYASFAIFKPRYKHVFAVCRYSITFGQLATLMFLTLLWLTLKCNKLSNATPILLFAIKH